MVKQLRVITNALLLLGLMVFITSQTAVADVSICAFQVASNNAKGAPHGAPFVFLGS
jgi:hypothetical protein